MRKINISEIATWLFKELGKISLYDEFPWSHDFIRWSDIKLFVGKFGFEGWGNSSIIFCKQMGKIVKIFKFI
jgi:hypothetical protein